MYELKAKDSSIVLIGKFNPVIINPNWLVDKELINELEAKEALKSSNYIIHPEVSQFGLPYCNIQTLQDRYTITSTQEGYFDKLHEITTAIFNFLRETPVTQMGINLTHHYEFAKENEWHEFGHRLVPKTAWMPVTKNPGLKRLEIISVRDDAFKGEINTSVGVSDIVPGLSIRIQVNDHYELYSEEELAAGRNINALKALKVLENWQQRRQYALKIIEGIITYDQK